MKRLRRHLSYSNILAVLAISFSLVGTAYARVMVTSATVVDNSLTGAKIKNGTLDTIDIENISLSLLRGSKGDTGDQGEKGPKGADGDKGLQGDPGDNISAVTAWAYDDTGLLRDWATEEAIPNDAPMDWDDATYGSNNTAGRNIRLGGYQIVGLSSVQTTVVALSGMSLGATNQSANSSGNITTTFNGNLSATAQLTFLHRDYDDGGAAQGPLHSRVECKLAFGNGANMSSYQAMGVPEWASADDQHGVVTMTITGNASNVGAGNYNVVVTCLDGDFTGLTSWQFVSGNLNVLAAQQ